MQPLSSTPSPSASPNPEALNTTGVTKDKNARSKATQQAKSVSLSLTGQKINQYTEAIADLPDVRQERIATIQAALRKGTYSVSAEDLADILIEDISSQTPNESSSST